MAYYDALKTAWNSVTQPPSGVTGTGLSAAMTTAQKLTAINAWTVPGPATPMIVPTYAIYNLIVPAEFSALSAANQQLVRDILGMGTVDASPGTQVRARIIAIFPNGTQTFTNLANLGAQYANTTIAWWQSVGYPVPIRDTDITAAGLS